MEASIHPLGAATVRAAGLTLEGLFRAHLGDVYRMVGRLLGPGASEADIEDVTQQVFISLGRALPSYRGEGKVTTWLYGVASRVVMTQLRGWRRHRRLLASIEQCAVRTSSRTPEQSASEREELIRVWRCLMKIRPKKRIVYVMHELEGLSGAEIAAALQIPTATVWTRLHHARRELLAALARAEAQDGLS